MLAEALTALQNAELVAALRGSRWAYPLVNGTHIVGIAMLFGSILPLDLWLLGCWPRIPLHLLARVLLPVAVTGLALAAVTGLLLFSVGATKYAGTPLFAVKLALLATAILNALLLRRSADWTLAQVPGIDTAATLRLRIAGGASIALWLTVILSGRFLAYVT